MAKQENKESRLAEFERDNDIVRGSIVIKAIPVSVPGTGNLKVDGWSLPGKGITKLRREAEWVAESMAKTPVVKPKARLGMAGPYAIPKYA